VSGLLQFSSLEGAKLPERPLHLAIGMFDGVHLGHQSVIDSAVHSARRSGGLAGVLTFWPHPSALFRPENPTPLLMPVEMKRRVLAELGIDFVIEQNFSREFAGIEAKHFVLFLQQSLPQLSAIYVGENFRFGRGRMGDVSTLVEEAKTLGVAVYGAERLSHNGAPISSSRIRELLSAGNVTEANALLGYSYFAEGVVERGRQLGRTIGFPTLNLAWEPELKPRFGVYAVEVLDATGNRVKGVASYGTRPTVETEGRPILEVHLLEESTLTYGDKLRVNWLQFLRPESKFGGLDELKKQIVLDVEKALKILSK
jgi:riboflavin kinase / FMN adenylyltransferase